MSTISKRKRVVVNLTSPKVLSLIGAVAGFGATTVTTALADTGETVGHIDVYIDHTDLDDAIAQASASGVTVINEPTETLTGNATETEANTERVEQYYREKAAEITKKTAQYNKDKADYRAAVTRNQVDADRANAQMDALKTNLAANNQTVVFRTKTYDAAEFAVDTTRINQRIALGDELQALEASVANFNTMQSSMSGFSTQASNGNIKVVRQTITVRTPDEVRVKLEEVQNKYTEMQRYINSLSATNGTIPDDQKPVYTLYDIVIDNNLKAQVAEPVEVFFYTPISVKEPIAPIVSYKFYDVRSKPDTDRHIENKDGETIIEASKGNTNGQKVVQAMVNQTVSIETDNQPLPRGRFDKFHSLIVTTHLPENVTLNEVLTKVDTENWMMSYDEVARTVTFTARPKYLLKINQDQAVTNGTVGSTMNSMFTYETPNVFFKLDKDDTTYQVYSETIVNDEYYVKGATITIRTDGADPEKHNYNSKLVQIDGKPVLPGSVNNYKFTWDFDQYQNVNIDREMQAKGSVIVDDYPEIAVDLKGPIVVTEIETGAVLYSSEIPAGATSGTFVDRNGRPVQGLTWTIIDNDTAPEELKGKLNGKAIKLHYDGFDNAFYKTYIEGGRSVHVQIPMLTKKIDNTPDEEGGTYNGNTYENYVYQSDFGNPYKSNTVTNTAPLIDPRKDAVLSFANLTSLDLKANPTAEIENGQTFQYRFKGSTLPAGLSEDIASYEIRETFSSDADEYTGEFIFETGTVFYFKDDTDLYRRYGVQLAANSEISKYFTQNVSRNVTSAVNSNTGMTTGMDTKVTTVVWKLDKDFIDQVDWSRTQLQIDGFIKTKRISNVDGVTNIISEVINGVDYGSNKVVTNSKANAIDELVAELTNLKTRVGNQEQKHDELREEVISALSVVIRSINDNKKEQDTKIEANTVEIEKLKEKDAETDKATQDLTAGIVNVNGRIDATNKVVDEIKNEVEANRKAIVSIKDLVTGLVDKLAKADAEATKTATMTIYDPLVTTDAEALVYATNRGVSAGSIKAITLNKDNKFVVTYNPNQSTSVTIAPVNANKIAETTVKFEFYAQKTEADVKARLLELGYDEKSIVSLVEGNGKFTVVVKRPVKAVSAIAPATPAPATPAPATPATPTTPAPATPATGTPTTGVKPKA